MYSHSSFLKLVYTYTFLYMTKNSLQSSFSSICLTCLHVLMVHFCIKILFFSTISIQHRINTIVRKLPTAIDKCAKQSAYLFEIKHQHSGTCEFLGFRLGFTELMSLSECVSHPKTATSWYIRMYGVVVCWLISLILLCHVCFCWSVMMTSFTHSFSDVNITLQHKQNMK